MGSEMCIRDSFTSSTNPDEIPPGREALVRPHYHRVRPEPAKLFQVNALSQTLLHTTSRQSLFIHFPLKQARQPPRSQPAYSAINCSGTHLFVFPAGTARKANHSYLPERETLPVPQQSANAETACFSRSACEAVYSGPFFFSKHLCNITLPEH